MSSIIKVDEILDSQGNEFDGSQLGNVGKVLQVKTFTYTAPLVYALDYTDYIDTGIKVAITPKSTSSTMLVTGNLSVSYASSAQWGWRLSRQNSSGSLLTHLSVGDARGSNTRGIQGGPRDYDANNHTRELESYSMTLSDQPNTLSEVNYAITCFGNWSVVDFSINRHWDSSADSWGVAGVSTITVMEIGV